MLCDNRFRARRTERKCSAGACPPLPAPAGDKPLHYRTGYEQVRGMARGRAHLPRAEFPRTVLGLSSTPTVGIRDNADYGKGGRGPTAPGACHLIWSVTSLDWHAAPQSAKRHPWHILPHEPLGVVL